LREQYFEQRQGHGVKSNGRRSRGNPIRTPSHEGQRPCYPSADLRYPNPSTAVRSQPRTEIASIVPERNRCASGPDDVKEFDRMKGVKGNGTMINGAESHRISCVN
jgi:hypothetical protein